MDLTRFAHSELAFHAFAALPIVSLTRSIVKLLSSFPYVSKAVRIFSRLAERTFSTAIAVSSSFLSTSNRAETNHKCCTRLLYDSILSPALIATLWKSHFTISFLVDYVFSIRCKFHSVLSTWHSSVALIFAFLFTGLHLYHVFHNSSGAICIWPSSQLNNYTYCMKK